MRRIYYLDGLDCANCASKLEKKLSQIEGIGAASVNFLTLKCCIDAEDEKMDIVEKRVIEIIKKEEPDVELSRLS